MSEKNSIDLEDPRSIIGTRVFDAPRDLMFSARTNPKHLAQWWGPNGFTTTTSAFEFRPSGVWRFIMHGPDGRDCQNRIIFDEWCRPSVSSIVMTAETMSKPMQSRRSSHVRTWAARPGSPGAGHFHRRKNVPDG